MPKYLSQNTDVLIFIFLFYRPRGRTLKSGHPPLRRLKIKQKFLNASRLSYTSYIKQNLFRGLFKGKHPPTTSKKFFKVFRDFMASLKSYFLNFLETKKRKSIPTDPGWCPLKKFLLPLVLTFKSIFLISY